MSTQNEKPPSPQTPGASPSRGVLAYVLGGVALGILLGALGLLVYQEHLPTVTTGLYYISIITFSGVVVLFVLFFTFKKYLIRYLLGEKAANAEHFLDDAQHLSDKLTVLMVDKLMPESAEEERDRAKLILPKLTHWFVWARIRNWSWQWLLRAFLAIGGLTGTLLLMNQNKLLETQNQLATNQMYLVEASRRSALVFLMSNILDKVDAEIASQKEKNPQDTLFNLTQSLIGQIVALSHSFKPYRYLEGDTLIERPLSPERGQLLMTLVLLPLDSLTRREIYKKSTFAHAALQKTSLERAQLSGIDLREADLKEADLYMADLRAANLWKADMRGAKLPLADLSALYYNADDWEMAGLILNPSDEGSWSFSDLSEANLIGAFFNNANLSGADLSEANFSESNLWGADLSSSLLLRANLENANLMNTNLNATHITLEQLESVHTLYESKNLDIKLSSSLMQTHAHLFQEPE